MKKDSKHAREAIRWLEGQFKQGNRFLRAQSIAERTNNIARSSQLKKDEAEAWRLSQLLDCCRYFQKDWSLNNTDGKRSSVVTLLTNRDPVLYNPSQQQSKFS